MSLRIIKLTAENIKRLQAIEITPPEHLVQITGANAQGKSSTLDAIAMVLTGSKAVPDRPIREGAEKGSIVVDIGDYTVTRTFTDPHDATKTTLKVTPKPGVARNATPQAILNDITGKLAFDPLAFAAMKPEEQFTTLAGLVDLGIDLKKWKLDRKATFDERTSANREIKRLEVQLTDKTPPPEGLPESEINLLAITQELEVANSQIRENDTKRRFEFTARKEYERLQDVVTNLEDQLLKAKANLSQQKADWDAFAADIATLEDPDTTAINQRIQVASQTNQAIREAANYRRLKADLEMVQMTADGFTADLDRMDSDRTAALQKATFPVPGLSLGDDLVTYNDLPFSQASDSEKLRVSMAVAMALNPTLRVILIRNASLLDRANLAIIEQLAIDNDFQVWAECVDESGEVGIVIEDGKVAWDNYNEPTPEN
jgi:DNA repair exonuclease SbcCD ATPase subunit